MFICVPKHRYKITQDVDVNSKQPKNLPFLECGEFLHGGV
jgi:hypothetical protein